MPPRRNPYDESSAYGTVHSVPGTESYTQPGQEGTYSQSVLPEYGRQVEEQPLMSEGALRMIDYLNPPDTVSTEEYDYRTGLRQARAQEGLLIEKSKAESAKAAGAGAESEARAAAIAKGDTTLEMIEKMPPHLQEIMRPTYILGKAGIKGQDLYDVLERIKTANTAAEKENIARQAAQAKEAKAVEPELPTRRGSTFLEDIISGASGGGRPGYGAGELGVGEEQGFETRREPVTRAGQGPSVEQWQRNPKTGKIERVS